MGGGGWTTVDRALGAFYGLAIGDALGMPTQMLPRAVVTDLFGELPWFAPGPDVNEISAGLPAGRVTDDTDQAVIVARTLIDGGGAIDPALLAERLLDWERAMAAAGSLDLLGPSTKRALAAVSEGAAPGESGRTGDTNGAAMRITPVGIATPARPLDRLCRGRRGGQPAHPRHDRRHLRRGRRRRGRQCRRGRCRCRRGDPPRASGR